MQHAVFAMLTAARPCSALLAVDMALACLHDAFGMSVDVAWHV